MDLQGQFPSDRIRPLGLHILVQTPANPSRVLWRRVRCRLFAVGGLCWLLLSGGAEVLVVRVRALPQGV